MTKPLGKLEKVDIRKIWEHEASNFTPWLAFPENLMQLGEEVGVEFDMNEIRTEVEVGDFNADILARDISGKTIIIENQLERTDHDHLGKCITYAAGVGAETIIWVTRSARDEHKQAVEWLNLNSSDKLNFFLVQIGAYKIGDSKPAPHFAVLEGPNEWTKVVRNQSGNNSKVTDTQLKQQEFFEMVRDYGQIHSKKVKNWQKPQPQNWYSVSCGSSLGCFNVIANTRGEHMMRVEVYIDGGKESEEENKRIFDKIYQDKDKIEEEIGKLNWSKNEGKRSKTISYLINKNPLNEVEAQEALPIIIEKLDQFFTIFPKYLKKRQQ